MQYERMRAVNGLDQLDNVKVTHKDNNSYEGTFSITGKNSDSVIKSVAGNFKVYY